MGDEDKENDVSKETGGPAFPWKTCEGMTLRDYFAAKAMQGVWARGGNMGGMEYVIAEAAYRQADAMLAEREK